MCKKVNKFLPLHLKNKVIIMHKLKIFCVFHISFFCFSFSLNAQKIAYSEPDRDEPKNGSFEIIGRVNNQYLIYKSFRNNHSIYVFNGEMGLIEKNKLEFLPDKIIDANFMAFHNFSYMFYQYQKRNIIYSMAIKIDANGKKIAEPIQLDTTEVNFNSNNKIYTILISENKQKIMSLKVNNKSDKYHIIKSVLFDNNLNQIEENYTSVEMPERNDFLNGFQLDNDGNLVFVRAAGNNQNNNINHLSIIIKHSSSTQLTTSIIPIKNIYLDNITVKIDNLNKRYSVNSFFSKQKRGSIDGLFCFVWDKEKGKALINNTSIFSDELRNEAKGENNAKNAFNDYYIRNIISRLDGGFMVIAESIYTSSRSGMNNRWDNWNNSPYWSGVSGGYYTYGYGSRMSSPWYPWGDYNNYSSVTRYYADNVLLLSFDSTSKIDWTNVIVKSQYDDNSDEMLGFTAINTGTEIKFLFNVVERRNWILNEQSISNEGQISRSPTLKNLERGYEFMPKHAKQVGNKQIIVPCIYRGYVCFAKIDLR